MTPLELWQAGGPEPVVVADLPCEPAFLPPWRWKLFETITWWSTLENRESDAAAEECRAALAAALIWAPPLNHAAAWKIGELGNIPNWVPAVAPKDEDPCAP